MTLPRFTAEAGLRGNVDRYGGASDTAAGPARERITPASGISIFWGSDCTSDCIAAPVTGGWCWCYETH
ncbi:MAG: hypothetical protein JHC95_12325 [Solirubrobacteraceae bacterium]|nr:hypothetical protein [Solirubrobacteraceae bacterium]